MGLIQQANDHYTSQAKSYSKTVMKKIQKELVAQILSDLYPCFDAQLKMVRAATYNSVQVVTQRLETTPID